jgi:hypothetical protein
MPRITFLNDGAEIMTVWRTLSGNCKQVLKTFVSTGVQSSLELRRSATGTFRVNYRMAAVFRRADTAYTHSAHVVCRPRVSPGSRGR